MFQNISSKGYSIVQSFLQRPYQVVGSLTVFGALLRLFHLGKKALWFDEAIMYWISQGSFKEVIAQSAPVYSAPPSFALLTNLILRISESEASLRAISCLAGIVAIPAMYFLARQFFSRTPAYFCTFLVVIATSQVRYSQQVREYSIAFLLAILMLAFFYRYLREPNWKDWTLLTLIWILSILMQYGLALLILSLNLVFAIELTFRAERRKQLVQWTITQLLGLGAVLVVYQLSIKHLQMSGGRGGTSYLAYAYWDGSLISLVKLAIKNTYELFTFAYPEPLFIFIVCVGFLVVLEGWRNHRTTLLLFVFPVLCTFAFACAQLYPYRGERQTIFLTPMLYILSGFGFACLSKVNKKYIIVLPLLVILGLGGLRFTYRYLMDPGKENIKPIITTLSTSFESGDRIYIYYGARFAFRYYYRSNQTQWIYGVKSKGQHDKYLEQVDEVLSQPGRVWMVFSHCEAPGKARGECQLIQKYASEQRKVELVAHDRGAWLYLAH